MSDDSWTTWFPLTPFAAAERRDVQLVCCPHAGGAAGEFRPWMGALGAAVEVCPVELPGRGARFRERPLGSVRAVADGLCRALSERAPARVAFFGHSFGASVAFEAAQRWEAERGAGSVVHLFVAGAWPPGLRREREKPLHSLDDEGLYAALGQFGGTPAAVLARPDLMDLLAPAVRADLRAHHEYAPAPDAAVHAPLTVFAGRSDAEVDGDALDAWAQRSRGATRFLTMHGGHFFTRTALPEILEYVDRTLSPGPQP